MKFLFDFFPVLLFFIAYKFFGDIPQTALDSLNALAPLALDASEPTHAIFLATAVGIIATFVQVSLFWIKHRRFERMHLIALAIFTVAGGATIILRDPVFIYWKPTILNGLFALVFLASQFVGKRTIVERMMSHAMEAPAAVWRNLNLAWVGYFLLLGISNLYVAYNFSEETWVNFKLFGWLGMTVCFIFAQAIYISRHATEAIKPGEES